MHQIKQLIKRAIASAPGWRLLNACGRPGGVAALMYHRITGDGDPFAGLPLSQFREQMRWLRRQCTPIPPEDLPERLVVTSRSKPPVLVTFDDGYRNYHDYAYPVLDELRIPAVVFLATAFMDEGGMIWTDLVDWASRESTQKRAHLPWSLETGFDLRHTQERERFADVCKCFLKDIPDRERATWIVRLTEVLEVDTHAKGVPRQMLNWDEVRATMGLTRYGGHTHTHPILSQLPAELMEHEIRLCRDRILAETGVAPKYFAYPNGRAQDFTAETKTILRYHGFEQAYTTIEGVNHADVDLMEIQRQPTASTTIGDFAWLVSGARG